MWMGSVAGEDGRSASVQESTVIVDDDPTVMNDFANDFNSTSSFRYIQQ